MNFKYIMVDIWGRSTRKTTDDKKTPDDEVKKLIKDEISNNFNLVNVDPGEIVVFGDKSGKLKTSNLSLDDLLTKPPNADDDSIVVFKSGKLAPSYNIKTLSDKFDKIAKVETDLDEHLNEFKNLRRNVIGNFFGRPKLVVTPSLADLKTITNKVKIPHDADKVNNVVYTRVCERWTWTPTNKFIFINSTVAGIYRLTLVCQTQFNLSGVNNMISVIIEKDATQRITITRADGSNDDTPMTYYVEFVVELKSPTI